MFKDIVRKLFSVPVSAVKNVRNASGEFLLKKTNFGLVRVDFDVVKKIAERALSEVKGIKESEIAIEKLNELNPMRIRLTAILVEGYSAPKISEAADKAVNSALKEFLRLEFYVPVDVKVNQIAQVVTKKRRVK